MILRLPLCGASLSIAVVVALALLTGCAAGGQRPPATPRDIPDATAPAPSSNLVQGLYESGRYREVQSSISGGNASPEALWFAAQSSLRVGQREEAVRQFSQLQASGAAWQVVSDLALALLEGDVEAIDRARAAAGAEFPSDPFVQFELGLAHARRSDFAAAVLAFDRCAEADPRFAYAYYNAGLAYDRLNRTDLMVTRLERFQRLAPEAPERPEVESILRTVRGR